MDKITVLTRLNKLVRTRGMFKTIEVDLKMPQNCLSNYASQKKRLPEKWVKPLADYFETMNKKRVILVENEDGKFLFMNPDGSTRKCTLVWDDLITEVVPDKTKTLPKKLPPAPVKVVLNKPERLPGESALDYRIRCI